MTATDVADTIDSEDIWLQLRKELEDVGISAAVVEEHHAYICNWLKTAISNGMLEEMAPGSHTVGEGSIDSGYGGSNISPSTCEPSLLPINVANEGFKSDIARHPSRVPSESSTIMTRSDVRIRKASNVSSVLFKLFKKDTAIVEAASDGDLSKVTRLISSGANVNARDRWGVSVAVDILHYCLLTWNSGLH